VHRGDTAAGSHREIEAEMFARERGQQAEEDGDPTHGGSVAGRENEEIPHRLVPERTLEYRSAADIGGDPEVGRTAAVEVEDGAGFHAADLRAGERLAERGERAGARPGDEPAVRAIPTDEGAGGRVVLAEAGDGAPVFD